MGKEQFPKGERVWMQLFDTNRQLKFIITSKEKSRETYFLYRAVDGRFDLLGQSESPKELQEKFQVYEQLLAQPEKTAKQQKKGRRNNGTAD